jgi:hypothetical protein
VADRNEAQWSAEQVEALNDWQTQRLGHPFTCPDRMDGTHPERFGDFGVLVATTDGWVCPDCDYTQDWAWQAMVRD